MNDGLFIVFWIYGICILLGLLMVCGEYTASTFTETKFSKWWREYIVSDGNDYPFE